jgi:mono/diheme cytochrome c family protein/DNA-binding beta-propeller fold protein YncE
MHLRARTILAASALLACTAAGCARGSAAGPAASAPASLPARASAASCARTAAAPAFTPLGVAAHQSSTVALARFGDRTVAFIADEDGHALTLVDLDRRAELASTPLPGAPSQLLLTTDGRVLVALRDESLIAVLEPTAPDAAMRPLCSVKTATEPLALALTGDEKTVLISSGWAHALSGHDLASLEKRFEVDLPREPRAVVVSGDGKSAFVAHAVGGQLSVVDLDRARHPVQPIRMSHARSDGTESGADRSTSCQGFALARSLVPGGRIFAPQVLVDPGSLEALPQGYGDSNGPTEQGVVAVIDEKASLAVQGSLDAPAEPHDVTAGEPLAECLLPRAAAVDPTSNTLLVACAGIDAVIAYDALSTSPARSEIRRFAVGGGPTGLAVDAERGRAVAWSQFDRSLTLLPLRLDDVANDMTHVPRPPERLALAPLALTGLAMQRLYGRHLFHAASDPRIAADGRACASCHPDGRDDAITWATPDGPRRTVMLAGRLADTAPYGWNGAGHDLREHLGHTFERLKGRGLSSVELEALLAYLQGLRTPQSPSADARAARGKELFHGAEAACATCHSDGSFTDGKSHDVGSKAGIDKAAAFDTPSLRSIASHAPYFHDGRYATLRELLLKSDKMGNTKQLTDDDLDALEAYLRSL